MEFNESLHINGELNALSEFFLKHKHFIYFTVTAT